MKTSLSPVSPQTQLATITRSSRLMRLIEGTNQTLRIIALNFTASYNYGSGTKI